MNLKKKFIIPTCVRLPPSKVKILIGNAKREFIELDIVSGRGLQ